MSIAEQMGSVLENTSHSVNMKERLDFSCAVFDVDANLVANAPHMPVHLGSMGESIQTVIRRNAGRMAQGDVYVLNDPYHGGTHLPDITVVTPVYLDAADARPSFYVASRGHHADVGGITPGSMPPFSKTIGEEGVLIDNFKLVEGGRLREVELRALLGGGAHPSRNIEQNLADLRAQIAANDWLPDEELQIYVEEYGRTGFQGGLNLYRSGGLGAVEQQLFAGRTIDQPSLYIAGASDWGSYQSPGTLERMQNEACTDMRGVHMVDGAGHWVQQEQPEETTRLLIEFLRGVP